MKEDEVCKMHACAMKHVRDHVTSKGATNDGCDHDKLAFDSVRSDVFAALQAESPPPGPNPDDDGDPEMHHMRQKMHNKMLWKHVDAIVESAGITEKGAE